MLAPCDDTCDDLPAFFKGFSNVLGFQWRLMGVFLNHSFLETRAQHSSPNARLLPGGSIWRFWFLFHCFLAVSSNGARWLFSAA